MTAFSLWQRRQLNLSPKRAGRRGTQLPNDLPALEFWYDAADSPVIAAGGVVERLDDLSGNANHAGQSTAGARPLKTLDAAGRSVIRFDGSDDSLSVASPPSFAAGVSVFMAFRMRTRTDFAGVLSAALSAGTDHVDFFTFQNASAASGLFQLFGRSAEADTLLWQPTDDGGLIYAIFALGDGDGLLRSNDGATTDTYDGSFATPDEIVLGARFASGVFGHSAIDLVEIGLYSQKLSDNQLDALESYLQAKYTFGGVVADAVFADGDVTGPDWAFSRPSTAVVRDHEGLYRACKTGELRHQGLRRVENLFTASDSPATQAITVEVGARYAFHFRDGGGSGSYALTGAATATVAEGEAFTFTAATTTLTATLSGTPGAAATVQLEDNSGASVNAPSEYVSIAETDNAKVAGVRYLTTGNGNGFTAPGPGTVTDAGGGLIAAATREGALLEPSATNLITDSNDLVLGSSLWAINGGAPTTAMDEVGIDGRANTATTVMDANAGSSDSLKLTRSAQPNGAEVSIQFWVKKMGASTTQKPMLRFVTSKDARIGIDLFTGAINLQFNTFTDFSLMDAAAISVGDWWLVRARCVTESATHVTYVYPAWSTGIDGTGISAALTGDIVLGHVQIEAGPPTSPIRTAGSEVTRTADTLMLPFRATPWTLFQDGQPQTSVDVAGHAIMGHASGSDAAQIKRGTSAYDGELDDGTDNPSASVLDSANGYSMGDRLKVALSTIDGDEALLAVNGSSASGTSAGTVDTSSFATIGVGMLQTGGPNIPITVRQAQLLSIAKTTGELEAMTTI